MPSRPARLDPVTKRYLSYLQCDLCGNLLFRHDDHNGHCPHVTEAPFCDGCGADEMTFTWSTRDQRRYCRNCAQEYIYDGN